MRRKAQERLAELVREYMRKTGKSQKEVAREACVTLSVLKNAVTEGHNASDEKMRQIAKAVGADWDELMAEAEGDTPKEQTEVEQLRDKIEWQRERIDDLKKRNEYQKEQIEDHKEWAEKEHRKNIETFQKLQDALQENARLKRLLEQAEDGGQPGEKEQLREQVALLEKNARTVAAERDDMEQRWLMAEQEKDTAVKEMQHVMQERDDAVLELVLATQKEHERKARADAVELELLRLKAGLYDKMMAERED